MYLLCYAFEGKLPLDRKIFGFGGGWYSSSQCWSGGRATHYHTGCYKKRRLNLKLTVPFHLWWMGSLREQKLPRHHYNYRKHQTLAGASLLSRIKSLFDISIKYYHCFCVAQIVSRRDVSNSVREASSNCSWHMRSCSIITRWPSCPSCRAFSLSRSRLWSDWSECSHMRTYCSVIGWRVGRLHNKGCNLLSVISVGLKHSQLFTILPSEIEIFLRTRTLNP